MTGPARLAFARRRVNRLFDSTCTIKRSGVVLAENVRCSVEDSNQSTARPDSETIPIGAFLVALPFDQDIRITDYIIERGRTLEVTEAMTPKSYEVRREVLAIRVGRGG